MSGNDADMPPSDSSARKPREVRPAPDRLERPVISDLSSLDCISFPKRTAVRFPENQTPTDD
jgi:hypothetical protein